MMIITFIIFYALAYILGGCILVGTLYLIDKYKPSWIDKIYS